MPAQSKSQQRFFGVVKAMQKGDIPKKGRAGKIAKTMSKDDVDDFASTKHKGLPNKVKREQRVRELIKKMVREELQETMCFDLQTERCWKGYTQKGMKKMFGKMYPNCVKKENVAPNHDGKAAPYGSGYKKAKKKIKEQVEPIGGMAKIAKIVKDKQHAKVGGQTVDMQSANLLMKLYNAVKDKDKEKMNKMSEKKLIVGLGKLWSRVKLKLPT